MDRKLQCGEPLDTHAFQGATGLGTLKRIQFLILSFHICSCRKVSAWGNVWNCDFLSVLPSAGWQKTDILLMLRIMLVCYPAVETAHPWPVEQTIWNTGMGEGFCVHQSHLTPMRGLPVFLYHTHTFIKAKCSIRHKVLPTHSSCSEFRYVLEWNSKWVKAFI